MAQSQTSNMKPTAVPPGLHFLERFNIKFLGSAAVPTPKGKDVLESALKTVLAKQRPGHDGTITITQLGVKWVKSGQFNGALYGINRVLYSSGHENSPCFSFIVKDKNVSRYICHCFQCESEIEADRINRAIGRSFEVLKQTRERAPTDLLHETYQRFEDTKLISGDLLSTHLDQGQGVDADEAMAALDAGFNLSGWRTPVGGSERPELSPMSPELAVESRSRASSTPRQRVQPKAAKTQRAASTGGHAQGITAPEPPTRKRFHAKPAKSANKRKENQNEDPETLKQTVARDQNTITSSGQGFTSTNPFAVGTDIAITNPFLNPDLSTQTPSAIPNVEVAKFEQAAFDEVNKLITQRRAEATSATPQGASNPFMTNMNNDIPSSDDLVTPDVSATTVVQVLSGNVDDTPSSISETEKSAMMQSAIDEVNKRIAEQLAAASAAEKPVIEAQIVSSQMQEIQSPVGVSSKPINPEEISVESKSTDSVAETEKLSPTKMRLKSKRAKIAALRAAREGKSSTDLSTETNSSSSIPAQSQTTSSEPNINTADTAVQNDLSTYTDSDNADNNGFTTATETPIDLWSKAAPHIQTLSDGHNENLASQDITIKQNKKVVNGTESMGNAHNGNTTIHRADIQMSPSEDSVVQSTTISPEVSSDVISDGSYITKSSQSEIDTQTPAFDVQQSSINAYEENLGVDQLLDVFAIQPIIPNPGLDPETSALWSAEEQALEEAMREIRSRLDQEDAEETDAATIEEASRRTSWNPRESTTSITSPQQQPSIVNEEVTTPVLLPHAPTTGIADMALSLKNHYIGSTESVHMPMSFDASLEAHRPQIQLKDIRPGCRGFHVNVKVIQQVFQLRGIGPQEIAIAEWLVADSTASAILKTVMPATATIVPGNCYELCSAYISISQDRMRLNIGHYGGVKSIANVIIPHEVLYKNMSTMALQSSGRLLH